MVVGEQLGIASPERWSDETELSDLYLRWISSAPLLSRQRWRRVFELFWEMIEDDETERRAERTKLGPIEGEEVDHPTAVVEASRRT